MQGNDRVVFVFYVSRFSPSIFHLHLCFSFKLFFCLVSLLLLILHFKSYVELYFSFIFSVVDL